MMNVRELCHWFIEDCPPWKKFDIGTQWWIVRKRNESLFEGRSSEWYSEFTMLCRWPQFNKLDCASKNLKWDVVTSTSSDRLKYVPYVLTVLMIHDTLFLFDDSVTIVTLEAASHWKVESADIWWKRSSKWQFIPGGPFKVNGVCLEFPQWIGDLKFWESPHAFFTDTILASLNIERNRYLGRSSPIRWIHLEASTRNPGANKPFTRYFRHLWRLWARHVVAGMGIFCRVTASD